jgi:hypothetical protein
LGFGVLLPDAQRPRAPVALLKKRSEQQIVLAQDCGWSERGHPFPKVLLQLTGPDVLSGSTRATQIAFHACWQRASASSR